MRRFFSMLLTAMTLLLLSCNPVRAITLETFLEHQDEVHLWYVVRDLGASSVDLSHQVVHISSNGAEKLVFLEYNEKSRDVTLLDEIQLPKGRLETQSCQINDRFDGEILAVFEDTPKLTEKLINPLQAWRASRKSDRFEAITNPESVSCYRRSDD